MRKLARMRAIMKGKYLIGKFRSETFLISDRMSATDLKYQRNANLLFLLSKQSIDSVQFNEYNLKLLKY